MKFVIMADGKGTRWNNYMGVPKHLVMIDGEPIIGRTVRLLGQAAEELGIDAEIIVTSHDSRYEFEGAKRHEPQNNNYEIDRFTEELIEDNMCFLYGDTIYSDEVIRDIMKADTDDLLFFGNDKSIVAVRIADAAAFRRHFDNVKRLYLDGRISKCKGWQIYQSVTGQDFEKKPVPGDRFIRVNENTTDINTPEEYEGKKL